MVLDANAILKARTARLAAVPSIPFRGATERHVIARADQLRYAVQADCVIGAVSVAQVCPLPGLLPTVAGLISYRSIPLVAFHSTAVLDQPRQALAERTLALVVGRHQPEFALLVDEASQVQDIVLDSLLAPPETLAPRARELIVGLSHEGVIVLKTDVLFESERLHVQTYLRRQR